MNSKQYSLIMKDIKTNNELYKKACKLTVKNINKLLSIHTELFKQWKTFILLILMIDSQGNENLDVVNNRLLYTMPLNWGFFTSI